MPLNKEDLQMYERIDFYKRYYSLCEKYSSREKLLEITDSVKVISLFQELGYNARYYKKENFFEISSLIENYQFYFHSSLKHGFVEIIFGSIDNITNSKSGGVCSRVCKQIKIAKGEKPIPIKPPSFSSYDELRLILKDSLLLYFDFQKYKIKKNER